MKKYDAFTLMETMIVIGITAILIMLSLKIYRNADEKAYGNLYEKAFKTLNVATYNIQMDVDNYNAEKDLEAQKEGKSGADDKDKKRFPYIDCTGSSCDTTYPTTAQLCTALTGNERGYINVSGSTSCTEMENSVFLTGEGISESPSFTTTDGMKYYLTTSSDSDYFFVWVDINGARRPNSSKYTTGNKRPDIVPFIINKSNGFVVPQGIPTYDPTYLKARVISAHPDLDKEYSSPMTFSEARKIAFQGKNWTLDPLSKNITDFDQTLPENYTAKADLTKASITTTATQLKCNNTTGYVVTRDFPPCTIEISMNTLKR